MKTIYLLSIIFFVFAHTARPQWTNQNPVPDGNHLFSTFFVDDNTGWIVGSDGFIKKTTNSGLDWIQQNSGTSLALRSVQFVNQNTGWICGEGGLLIKTTNGGQNWFELISGTTVELTDLQFYDTETGYAVGYNGTVIKTTDGGLFWFTQSSGTTGDLYSVDFVSDLLGFAVGGVSKFLKTTDGGVNWMVNDLPIYSSTLNCVDFIDSNVGWIGSGTNHEDEGTISKTTDGGATWSSYNLRASKVDPTNPHKQGSMFLFDIRYGIQSIYFKDSDNGYAVGGSWDGWNRCIYSTSDAGATWQIKYSYAEQTGLVSVFMNNAGKGWAVGFSGLIYISENNGDSWSQILSGKNNLYYAGDWISSVFMTSDSIGWAAGFRKGTYYKPIILKTTNAGKTWVTNSEFSSSLQVTNTNIFFLNNNIGWITFDNAGSFKTTDGGENWFPSGNAGNEKYFINQDTGWGAHEVLGIFKSTDGGNNWVQKSSVGSRSICFSIDGTGWAAGDQGSILKSTDQGESWITKISGTTCGLNSVRFYDENAGMCVGKSGTVLISSDGGENWIPRISGTTNELTSVKFTNANTVWIAGSNGTILNSSDFGVNWYTHSGVTETDLASVYFTDESTGWVCGDNNIIIYEEDVTPVELSSFTAEIDEDKILLNWQTSTELNNFGFEIQRRIDVGNWDILGFVEGHGNSTTPNFYSFIDNNTASGNRYQYRLKQIDINGEYEYSNEIEIGIGSNPGDFVLYQNYPNPFNPSTKIKYSVGTNSNSPVQIKVYDLLGKEVETLVNENNHPGIYELEFDASGLASGIYIYKLIAGDFAESKKMILLR